MPLTLQDFRPERWLTTLATGLIAGAVAIITSITYATVVFSGELEPYQSTGIGLALFSAALLCVVNALGSSYPGTVAVPQDAPAIMLGLMAGSIAGKHHRSVGQNLHCAMAGQ